jgi:ubiquinone/menaquinone biosynthesis C-methylase UbiE
MDEIFDKWPEKYDQWFQTPLGRLVKKYENDLILEMLEPGAGERILDAGCGSGVFTFNILAAGAHVDGLEISLPMLLRARDAFTDRPFRSVQGDMLNLPFPEDTFDKVVSITALEFIDNARAAVREAFRVTKPGGCIVIATLNSLSPWAIRRKEEAKAGHALFQHATFRSPSELEDLSPVEGTVKTAIHFQKDDDLDSAKTIEKRGRQEGLPTGAFLAARWVKPV